MPGKESFNVSRRRLILGAALLAGLVVLAVGCGGGARIEIAQLPIAYSAVSHIADAEGFWRKAGLNYAIRSPASGPEAAGQLQAVTNPAQVATIAITPVMTMIGGGGDPVILATILLSNKQTTLVTWSGSGIGADPSTLRGKTIGVVRNTNGDVYLWKLLRKAGLKETDVQLRGGRPADLASQLVNGQLDAAVLWDPYVHQAIASMRMSANRQPMAYTDSAIYTLAFNVVTTKSQVEKYRSELRRVLQGLIQAEAFIGDQPDSTRGELARWLNRSPDEFRELFQTSDVHVSLNKSKLRQLLADEYQWLLDTAPSSKHAAPWDTYIDDTILKSIDATRVME